MRNTFILVLVTALASFARADVPATAFFVLETSTLKQLSAKTPPGQLTDEQLAEAAITSGMIIEGSANFSVKTKAHTLYVKLEGWQRLKEDGRPFLYRIGLSERESKKAVFNLSGQAVQDGKQSITENWQQEEFVVIFRFHNLLR